ncbi:MAG: TdeIII family type II restriction endonuclease [Bacteroidales bacterium]|jgi:type II restriction enzyme|nr:TdeIII family type II restriction endonuclease [Bacteroidales bacterium]
MALTNEQKIYIQQVITTCLRNKFQNYKAKNNYSPFHFRLLGRDRMALYSFMQSLLTAFGSSIFEPVAEALSKVKFAKAETQYVVGNTIFSDCQHSIQNIINTLTCGGTPDKKCELQQLRSSLSGNINKLKPVKADLFIETENGEKYLFDLKTTKPNKGDFQKYKQTLLEWAGIEYTTNSNIKIHTLIAIPYNPYEPQPYQRWTMKGMLDLENELKVAEDFWDFLGGEGTYTELLDCFEKAGVELRPEIDEYFANFK